MKVCKSFEMMIKKILSLHESYRDKTLSLSITLINEFNCQTVKKLLFSVNFHANTHHFMHVCNYIKLLYDPSQYACLRIKFKHIQCMLFPLLTLW